MGMLYGERQRRSIAEMYVEESCTNLKTQNLTAILQSIKTIHALSRIILGY